VGTALIMVERLILALATLLLAMIWHLPIAAMLGQTLIADGGFSLNAYRALLTFDSRLASLMGHSLLLSFLTASVSTLIGVPLGVLLGKSDIPLRGTLTLLFVVPLLIPSYVMAVAWFSILGRTGFLDSILPEAWSQAVASTFLGLIGCTFVLTSAFMPIAMLLTIAFLQIVNPQLENAARLVSLANNAASNGAGGRLCRRAHISSLTRRDRRAYVSALPGLSGRNLDTVRRLL
jgi:iron(III) transport system permease protein